jgi:predicted nucleic acid-binding protein
VILADTSAWVEFDRATGSPVDKRLTELISAGDGIAVTEPIVMEVLSGAKDDRREQQLRRLLLSFQLIHFDASVDFDGAVRVWCLCRSAGVTPRGLIDCMIATVAWRRAVSLLAFDRDLARVASILGLEMDKASLGPG